MNEMKMDGKTFQYEKLAPERFKKGACAFRIKNKDGDEYYEYYLVVIPPTLKAQLEGTAIDSPDDGHIAAFCMSEQDALMLVSGVCLATSLAHFAEKAKVDAKGVIERKAKVLAEGLDLDLDALKAEVKRLKSEGKSAEEVSEILKPRMEEFLRKDPKPETKGGEW